MDRYVMISADCHAGAPGQGYRPYVEPAYRERFDQHMKDMREMYHKGYEDLMGGNIFGQDFIKEWRKQEPVKEGGVVGAWDADRRVRELESDGVVAEVMFPDQQSGNSPPFGALEGTAEPELQTVGARAYNRWLADFCSQQPDRMGGIALLTLFDIEWAVQEIQWARKAGLRGVMIPPSTRELPLYNHPRYEPVWATCEATEMPLHFHAGTGTPIYGNYPGSRLIYASELRWFAHRPLWVLVWGGVMERYPRLKVIFTEQGSDWIPSTLAFLDGHYQSSRFTYIRETVKRKPSEYWARQCYVGASFLNRQECEMRREIGVNRMMWGSDYPHLEGTWPKTKEKLHETFVGVPEGDARKIVGENAARVYGFDLKKLAAHAERVGPRVGEL